MNDPDRTPGTVPPNPCREGHVFVVGRSRVCLCGAEDLDRAPELVKSLSRSLAAMRAKQTKPHGIG